MGENFTWSIATDAIGLIGKNYVMRGEVQYQITYIQFTKQS